LAEQVFSPDRDDRRLVSVTSKDLFPIREPRLNSAVPCRDCVRFLKPYPALRTGLLSAVPANAGTHNSRCHRNHLASILLTYRVPMEQPGLTMPGSGRLRLYRAR
jgi:hypothetical protein